MLCQASQGSCRQPRSFWTINTYLARHLETCTYSWKRQVCSPPLEMHYLRENVLSGDLQFSYSFRVLSKYTLHLIVMGFVVSWDRKIESDVYRYWMPHVRTHRGEQKIGDLSLIKYTHTHTYIYCYEHMTFMLGSSPYKQTSNEAPTKTWCV